MSTISSNIYSPNDYIYIVCKQAVYIKQLKTSGPINTPLKVRMSTAYSIVCSGIKIYQYDPVTKRYALMTIKNAFKKDKFDRATSTTTKATSAMSLRTPRFEGSVRESAPEVEPEVTEPVVEEKNEEVVETVADATETPVVEETVEPVVEETVEEVVSEVEPVEATEEVEEVEDQENEEDAVEEKVEEVKTTTTPSGKKKKKKKNNNTSTTATEVKES